METTKTSRSERFHKDCFRSIQNRRTILGKQRKRLVCIIPTGFHRCLFFDTSKLEVKFFFLLQEMLGPIPGNIEFECLFYFPKFAAGRQSGQNLLVSGFRKIILETLRHVKSNEQYEGSTGHLTPILQVSYITRYVLNCIFNTFFYRFCRDAYYMLYSL